MAELAIERRLVDGKWRTVAREESAPLLQTVQVDLDHAQILTLASTPVEIVPATEILDYASAPSQLPLPVAATVTVSRASATNYDNIDEFDETSPNLILCWGSDWSVSAALASRLGVPPTELISGVFGIISPAQQMFRFGILDPDHYREVDFLDNGLYVVLNNDDDLTGGDPDDLIRVSVTYATISPFPGA